METTSETIKRKPNLILALIAIAFGVFLLLKAITTWIKAVHHPQYIVPLRIAAVIELLFWGAILALLIYTILSKKYGVTINNEGINEHSTFASIGFIPWKNINKIEVKGTWVGKFILIFVTNPEEIMNQHKGWTGYNLRRMNKKFQTPITIAITLADPNFNKLPALLIDRLKYQQGKG